MSQEQVESIKLTVTRTFEWLSRFLQAVLIVTLVWFGSEVVELRTQVAVMTARLESATQLSGANLTAALQRLQANDQHDERQDNRMDAMDTRLRAVERSSGR